MKPFLVLIFTFIIGYAIDHLTGDKISLASAGCISMAVMLFFTSIAHFKFMQGMVMMMPAFIPFKKPMVIITGLMEIAAGICLCIPSLRYITAVCLIVFFIIMLPANIHAAIKKVDYENANYNGKGLSYLWFRVPLQLFFITWVWYFGMYLS